MNIGEFLRTAPEALTSYCNPETNTCSLSEGFYYSLLHFGKLDAVQNVIWETNDAAEAAILAGAFFMADIVDDTPWVLPRPTRGLVLIKNPFNLRSLITGMIGHRSAITLIDNRYVMVGSVDIGHGPVELQRPARNPQHDRLRGTLTTLLSSLNHSTIPSLETATWSHLRKLRPTLD